MTNTLTTYSLPELTTLPTNSFDVAPKFKPELTRLYQGLSASVRYLLPYRVCYLDRHSLNPTIRSLKEREKVNISSLCARRAGLIQPIVRGLLEGQTGIPRFKLIEFGFDWIDQQGRSDELYSLEGARRLYIDYTDYLRHRLRLSNVGNTPLSMGYTRAQTLQSALAYICAIAAGQDPEVVRSWCIRIPSKKIGLNELPAPATTADEHALAYALHQRFFESFSQAILNNMTPPVVVKLVDLGFEDLIFYSRIANNAGGWSTKIKGARTDWQQFFYRSEGVFEGTRRAFNAQLAEHGIAPLKLTAISRMKSNNRYFTRRTLFELANYATRHFGYLLLAEAGNNASHLASINCHDLKLDKAMGLVSTRAIKGRAGFEEQEQLVDSRFAQKTWRHYQKLRNWMANQLETPPKLGLFLLNIKGNSLTHNPVTSISIPILPLWPANGPSLSTRSARKHKSVNLLESSGGNALLVAGMQFATPKTIERHYAFKNREEAAKVMSDYFTAQAKSAELQHMGIKPVRIIDGGETTHTGICDSREEGPKLIDGFEVLAIEPRCGSPITCIFCVHFGLHADAEEILRLLTLKLWIEVQSRLNSINIDDHFHKFLPYINRIQQILEDLSNMNDGVSEHFNEALTRFERGERDEYWYAKINALLHLEES